MITPSHPLQKTLPDWLNTLPKDLPLLIVDAPYYADIAGHLRMGAQSVAEHIHASCEVISVPGALEIPQALNIMLATGNYAAAVVLGCIIRGETFHFDIVATESARGVMDVALRHAIPVGNAILTVDTMAQAEVRADPDKLNKGGEAMLAALSVLAHKYRAAKMTKVSVL